jgi:group I intron endonuclease
MYGTVYIIHCLVNGKYYVGQTIRRLRTRFIIHSNQPNTYIAKAMRKYGRENFIIEPICEAADPDELNRLECLWIIALASYVHGIGYNCKIAGALLPEIVERGAAKRRGKTRTVEQREKVSAGLIRYFETHVNPKKGRPIKESQREKLKALKGPRNSRWGAHDTPEVIERRRQSLLGKHWKHRKARRSGMTNAAGKRSEKTILHMRWLRLIRRLSGPRLVLQHATGNYF